MKLQDPRKQARPLVTLAIPETILQNSKYYRQLCIVKETRRHQWSFWRLSHHLKNNKESWWKQGIAVPRKCLSILASWGWGIAKFSRTLTLEQYRTLTDQLANSITFHLIFSFSPGFRCPQRLGDGQGGWQSWMEENEQDLSQVWIPVLWALGQKKGREKESYGWRAERNVPSAQPCLLIQTFLCTCGGIHRDQSFRGEDIRVTRSSNMDVEGPQR